MVTDKFDKQLKTRDVKNYHVINSNRDNNYAQI